MIDDKPKETKGRGAFENWRYHVALGLHSNFPVCCILWWLTVWPYLWRRQFASKWFRGCGYVRCPLCVLTGRVVAVRHCNCMWDCDWKEVHKQRQEKAA